MGTLANSLFRTMLGWLRTLSAEVWSAFSSQEGSSLLGWIGNNWKLIALVLCVFGAVTDLIVYLIRWRPMRVWRSFFYRLRNPEREEEEENPVPEEPAEDYSFRQNYAPAAEAEAYGRITEKTDSEENREEQEEQEAFPAWQKMEPEGTTAYFEQAIRPRRRRVTRLFTEKGEDTVTPDQLIDQYAAYRRPVYPRSWKADEGDSEETE
ncbi:MAG: hypothetical protein II888_03780 [Clostridia bacterium]|nr:hypothetical protein [Clostridia bacterium]